MKTGDKVKVISGANKGKEGKILRVKDGLAIVEGLGLRVRHLRKSQFNPAGGKKDIQVGIHMSNLKLVEAAKVEKKSEKKSEAKAEKKPAAKKTAKKETK